MKSICVQTKDEFRIALSGLKRVTVDLLLLELQDYKEEMFIPKLFIKSENYNNYHDFEQKGERFLNSQFALDNVDEKLVYKRQSDNEVYGFIFCKCKNNPYYENCLIGNILGVIYMKED